MKQHRPSKGKHEGGHAEHSRMAVRLDRLRRSAPERGRASGALPSDYPRAEGDRDDALGEIQDRGTEDGHPRR